MKKLALIIFISFSFNALAQDFEVPENYVLKTKQDYAKYEKDFIKAVDWITATPLNKEMAKRKKAYQFIIHWLEGSPTVTVNLNGKIINADFPPDCLLVYMGAYAKNIILQKEKATALSNNLTAINTLITFYKKNKKQLGRNKTIEKYIKLQKKNKLEKFLKSKL
jgi:hypothetical protein